ncbi:MAG TPA: beta-ketoacyl-ACP synthase 3 [Baekduia sp.]|nr:beta-ketoacyl-ACP synthase 3 [Baekduia sp.]
MAGHAALHEHEPAEAPSARIGAAIAGVGHAVPPTIVTNAEIARRLGVDEDWIVSRTGTRERHVLGPGERLADLAAAAAAGALEQARVAAHDVELVLVGTTSSDEMSPHTAALVAGDIGADGAAAMDVSAACTGFLSGLSLAAAAIEAGRIRTALVLGADGLSRYVDRDDRGPAMLFGDGAGAAVLTATDGPARVGPVLLRSDATNRHLIRLARDESLIRMDGPTVFRHAVRLLSEVTHEATAAAGIAVEDVDLFVYHQANARIVRAVGRELALPDERVVDVVDRFANTSAASLPIALSVARDEGRLRPGATVLLAAFGAGLVWGGAVVRWPDAA